MRDDAGDTDEVIQDLYFPSSLLLGSQPKHWIMIEVALFTSLPARHRLNGAYQRQVALLASRHTFP
jgi:hypothetical protein